MIKLGSKIIIKKEFKDYYVITSPCGWAVTTIPPETTGIVEKYSDNSIVVKLLESTNPRTIKILEIDKKLDFFIFE